MSENKGSMQGRTFQHAATTTLKQRARTEKRFKVVKTDSEKKKKNEHEGWQTG